MFAETFSFLLRLPDERVALHSGLWVDVDGVALVWVAVGLAVLSADGGAEERQEQKETSHRAALRETVRRQRGKSSFMSKVLVSMNEGFIFFVSSASLKFCDEVN